MLFPCTDIGERPKSEFRWGGYLDDSAASQEDAVCAPEWRRHLWGGKPGGVQGEWWFHHPSEQWYIGFRDAASERFVTLEPAQACLARQREGGTR
ncbi:sarcosine oxidase subunit delta [Novosphingobium sp. 1949]|uniref:Sarcosine oxidase subunit delta n=1 Tax=Novosphingobium organovorum TaxID=2930092 RepID=A0ABT0BCR5_9SPHN|nr:sarcosine oxidase subunit delta [Novosphingobium organovorum]MCJ2182670.1 sarcosine oxidase subunit delta [Novosphingobium organovorum]